MPFGSGDVRNALELSAAGDYHATDQHTTCTLKQVAAKISHGALKHPFHHRLCVGCMHS